MASELEARIIGAFAEDFASKLNGSANIARTASGLSGQGLPKRAFRKLLDIETLIHNAATCSTLHPLCLGERGEGTIGAN